MKVPEKSTPGGWLRRGPDSVVPLASLQAALAETFAIAWRRSPVIWTNRLPAPALEGYEHYIQDPHKLEGEVRGRHEHLQQMVRVPACADCEHRPRCAGMDAAHLARFGPDEQAP